MRCEARDFDTADADDPDEITWASARLRQQFQKLKERLRDLAITHGLLPRE